MTKVICGVDEAGRGPLAGPVVAASVILNGGRKINGIKDSKKLTPKQREKLFFQIIKYASCIGISIVSTRIIDKTNIHSATYLAMKEAILNMRKKPHLVLVDGKFTISDLPIPQKAIISGDSKIRCISAASIIAKVTRDRIMNKSHKHYPLYEFCKHKGYGTKLHMKLIKKFGPCPIHRRHYSPISKEYYPA